MVHAGLTVASDVPDGLERLAIFGAAPAFPQPLHVGRPNIGNRTDLLQRITGILDRNWFTNDGPCVREFEARIREYVGVKHAVAMCNATIALEIATRAMDLRGEVIVPSYTFVATAHALQWQEITPVFCDIDPDTHCMDPAKLERMITPRTTGVIGVHLWGQPCAVEALQEITDRRGLKLLFDAAHAFGCSHGDRMIGSFGEAEVFSFHATKFMNSFEGGAVVTDNDALAERMRLMRNFGFVDLDRVIHPGTNGKMPEICAAMGLTSFDALDDILAINRRNYKLYQAALRELPGLRLKPSDGLGQRNYQYIVVEVDHARCGLRRDDIVDLLRAENCLARRYFWPGVHNMEPYRSLYPHSHFLLESTKYVAERVFLLPTGTAIDGAAIDTIGELLRTALQSSDRVRAQLTARRRAGAT
jgi:dTDP-4-amino-4,6-dideoxygalactose transaminase